MGKSVKASNVPNAPAFSAYASNAQSLTGGGEIKIALNAEEFDTNSNFDSATNYRFQPTVPGYYQLEGSVTNAGVNATYHYAVIFKNGSAFKYGNLTQTSVSAYGSSVVSALVYFNGSTDYVELYGVCATTVNSVAGAGRTYFQGFLARPA